MNDIQTPLPLLRKSQFMFFVQNDAKCFEINGKLIFRFLFFELLMILYTILKCFNQPKNKKIYIFSEDAQCSDTDFLVHEFFCVIFSFWDMYDLLLINKSLISQKMKITKIENLNFHSFQNIAQQFGQRNENGSFFYFL